MPNIQRIQTRIDQIPSLIKIVEALRPISNYPFCGYPIGQTYVAEDLRDVEDEIKEWKEVTIEILSQELGDTDPHLLEFCSRWRSPMRDYDIKARYKRKLLNARSDLRILLAVAKEKDGDQLQNDDIWALVHPSIRAIARDRIEDGYYADAVEAACKLLNATVREIVKARTNRELDGAKLMQCAFSVENPIIRLSKDESQSGKDTQQGYMQIFSGVMTGIRNPRAHDNETITKEDALR